MLSKNARPGDRADLPPDKRLRSNFADLHGRGLLSAARVQELCRDATSAGASGCADLAGNSTSRHAARDLSRRLLKWSLWPDTYEAEVTIWDTRRAAADQAKVHFLLPHEVVASLARASDAEKLRSKDGLDPNTLAHLCRCEEASGSSLLGLGLWGDGVPCNWDRSESVQVFSLNLPGLPPPWRGLRIPLVGFSKKHFAGKATHDSVMEVLAWSFQQLAMGRWPMARHDGLDWQPGDAKRQRKAGQAVLRSALVELRGDWAHMKECFGFPAWNEVAGICWLCKCTPAQVREVDEGASWRGDRLSHWELLERMVRNGVRVSPIFSVPWVQSTMFRPDWLHCADQGVAADFLGNYLMYFVEHKMAGANRAARCANLWLEVQGYYAANNVADRLQNLTVGMLAKAGSPPKLRSSAAQCRALVGFGAHLAPRLSPEEPIELAMRAAATQLQACYAALSASAVAPHASLALASRRFAAQYVALERAMLDRGDAVSWRVKPKLHMFLELCSDGSQPSLFWTYRDEDFGGSCAHMARRRGGLLMPSATSKTLLTKFKILQPPARIV